LVILSPSPDFVKITSESKVSFSRTQERPIFKLTLVAGVLPAAVLVKDKEEQVEMVDVLGDVGWADVVIFSSAAETGGRVNAGDDTSEGDAKGDGGLGV
jgi:hypothetical protein